MSLPVYVSYIDRPEVEELVYAMIDSQSTISFVTSAVCDRLGIKGINTSLHLTTMTSENEPVNCRKVFGLVIRGPNNSKRISISKAFSKETIPVNPNHIPSRETAMSWNHLKLIAEEMSPKLECDVGLLIGCNCPLALTPRLKIDAPTEEPASPFAVKTDLGWSIIGNPIYERSNATFAFRIKAKEVIDPIEVLKVLESDFVENHPTDQKSLSYNDKQFLDRLLNGIHVRNDSHYEMPLPFKTPKPKMPNNRDIAMARLKQLERKLRHNQRFRSDYTKFMDEIITKGYAEEVPRKDKATEAFYIPHHGIYHPKKPEKIRVVFDCSSKCENVCLNDKLLQGPDMMNNLTGILCRFRKEPVAIAMDIKKMFYQFHVDEDDRNYLRFLWWKNGNLDNVPSEYRMTVHLFGAVLSPACANFALKKAAEDGKVEFGKRSGRFLFRKTSTLMME